MLFGHVCCALALAASAPIVLRLDRPKQWRIAHHRNGRWHKSPGGNTLSRSLARAWDKPFCGHVRYRFPTKGHDAVTKLKKAGGQEKLIAEAQKALAIDDRIVKDLTHFTTDPKALPRARASVARLIERVGAAGRASGR